MATQYFSVPSDLAGKSLRDLSSQYNFNPGVLSGFLGMSETQPLTAGQTIDTSNFPSQYVGSSSEYQALSKMFQPGLSPGQQLAKTQEQQLSDLMGKYQTQVTGQEALPAAYERLTGAAGIPQLQQEIQTYKGNIYKTQDLIDRLEEDINQRTKGTMTTEAQRRRQLAAEGAPLTTELGRLATGLQPYTEQLATASGNVATELGLLGQQQQKELLPVQAQIAAFSDQAARQISLYTTDKEADLNLLTQKLKQQGDLSLAEYTRASDLLKLEQDNQNKKEQIAAQMTADIQKYRATTGSSKSTPSASITGSAVLQSGGGSISNLSNNYFSDLGGFSYATPGTYTLGG